MKILAVATVALLGALCVSGFFYGTAASPDRKEVAPACARPAPKLEREESGRDELRQAYASVKPAGLLARVNSPEYRRTADLSLKVGDCVKAEDDLEGKLEKIRGEILDMLMEGTEGSRRCALRVLVPSPSFRAFVSELRSMGKVQAEKITASKLKSGSSSAPAEEVDPRELCLVSIRMADEKVAQAVLEGRGTLASSFDRSASHLLMGAAVLVEGLGYVLPFGLAGAALLVPALLLRRLRKPR
jgi:hypothetical protein